MGTKGIRSKKGQGELYSSPKMRIGVSLTPELVRRLDAHVALCKSEGVRTSRSELIEEILRSWSGEVDGFKWGKLTPG